MERETVSQKSTREAGSGSESEKFVPLQVYSHTTCCSGKNEEQRVVWMLQLPLSEPMTSYMLSDDSVVVK